MKDFIPGSQQGSLKGVKLDKLYTMSELIVNDQYMDDIDDTGLWSAMVKREFLRHFGVLSGAFITAQRQDPQAERACAVIVRSD